MSLAFVSKAFYHSSAILRCFHLTIQKYKFLTDLYEIIYYSQVMSGRLPIDIDPESLIEKQSELSGILPLSTFVRLSESLTNDQGVVDFNLFFRKEGDIKAIMGHVNATLLVQCQRCLETVSVVVDQDFKLGVVQSDQEAKRLPGYYEPLLLESNQVVLRDIIEDELILAIPDIPKHRDCQPQQKADLRQQIETEAEPNPFAILAKLKSKEK